MKKFIALAAALTLALALCACGGGTKNELFVAASPETSALMLHICEDGESVRSLSMYDTGAERALLDKLSAVKAAPAQDWTPRDVTVPVYGIETGRNDGEPGWLEYAWSNGYLIASDGTAYKFDFDFAALETDFDWRDREEGLAIGRLPCSRALAQYLDGSNAWEKAMLSPAPELSPPEGISMTDAPARETNSTTVALTNARDTEWCYGTYYHLEVELDGEWYIVPPAEAMDFNDIGLILSPGETREETYSMDPYGNMPGGHYRLVVEGMAVESHSENCFPIYSMYSGYESGE